MKMSAVSCVLLGILSCPKLQVGFSVFLISVFNNWHPKSYHKIAYPIIQVTDFSVRVPDAPELPMHNGTWGAQRSLGQSCWDRMPWRCVGVEMPCCGTRGWHSVLTQISGRLFRSFLIWVFTNWHRKMYHKIACPIIQVTDFFGLGARWTRATNAH